MAKTLIGTVSSTAPDKTIVISVNSRQTHPLYKKQYTVTSKYIAHDENNDCKVGDKVSIIETRPLSARKRHTLHKIIQRTALSKEDKEVIDKSAETSVGAADASSEEIAS
jgi:small subunit ribosomal protein S17